MAPGIQKIPASERRKAQVTTLETLKNKFRQACNRQPEGGINAHEEEKEEEAP
jgi:hypothetical protein